MNDPRIRLKNRMLAVILAWLLPGAGHLYQGRRLKSAIYFCSIMGLWIMAMHLSEWKVMAAPIKTPGESRPIILVLKFGAKRHRPAGPCFDCAGRTFQERRKHSDQ